MVIHDSSGPGTATGKLKLSRIDYENEHAEDEHTQNFYECFFSPLDWHLSWTKHSQYSTISFNFVQLNLII